MVKSKLQMNLKKFLIRRKARIRFSLQKRKQLPYWLTLFVGVSLWVILFITLSISSLPLTRFGVIVSSVVGAFVIVQIINRLALLFVNSNKDEIEEMQKEGQDGNEETKENKENLEDKALYLFVQRALQKEIESLKGGD